MAAVPIVLRVAEPSRRDQRPLSSRLAQLAPETLARIIADAERGRVERWADLCDRMYDVDGHVRANYETRLGLVAGTRWELVPTTTGDPARDAHSVAAAQFCERFLQDISGFDQAVMDLLDGVGVGFAVQELGWMWDGPGGLFRIGDMTWLHPRRFEYGDSWELRIVDLGGGELAPGGRPLSDWPWRFLVHAPRTRPNYPTKTGVFRAVAWPFLFKRWAVQFWARGAERFAWPFLWGQVNRNASKDIRQKMQDALDRMSSETTAVVEEGVIQMLESTVKDGGTWRGFFEAMNHEISKAILGSVDQTEPTKVGAWKAVESRKGTTVDPRTAIDERGIAATVRGGILTPALEFNRHRFGGVLPPVPMIRWVVTGQRREIPESILRRRIVRRNEVRQSLGFDQLEGPEGDEWVGDGEPSPPAALPQV